MNLPMRQDKKRNQALDAFASLAKTWSEWRLGERAAKSVSTGTKKASKAAAKARKRAGKSDSSGVKSTMKSTPMKIAGAAALIGGVGAAVAKKLKGGGTAEPFQTPGGQQDVPPAPSTPVKVGDVAGTESAVATSEQAIAAAGQRADDEPAEGASEKAAGASTAPPPAGTEPSIPDTDVDAAADTTGDDEVEDAMEVHSDSGAEAAGDTEPAVSAEADPGELERAPAGDGHDDDSPTVPADDAKS